MTFGERLLELLPHYLLMIAVIFAVLIAVQELFGELGFWPSFAVALAVAIAYPRIVNRLGFAPDPWR